MLLFFSMVFRCLSLKFECWCRFFALISWLLYKLICYNLASSAKWYHFAHFLNFATGSIFKNCLLVQQPQTPLNNIFDVGYTVILTVTELYIKHRSNMWKYLDATKDWYGALGIRSIKQKTPPLPTLSRAGSGGIVFYRVELTSLWCCFSFWSMPRICSIFCLAIRYSCISFFTWRYSA